MLFEHVLKTKDDASWQTVLRLANEGIVPRDLADILHEPYMLDFIDLPGEEPLLPATYSPAEGESIN